MCRNFSDLAHFVEHVKGGFLAAYFRGFVARIWVLSGGPRALSNVTPALVRAGSPIRQTNVMGPEVRHKFHKVTVSS